MNVNRMLETLPLVGKGMAGVFAVTLVILLSMCLLNRLGGRGRRMDAGSGQPGADSRAEQRERSAP